MQAYSFIRLLRSAPHVFTRKAYTAPSLKITRLEEEKLAGTLLSLYRTIKIFQKNNTLKQIQSSKLRCMCSKARLILRTKLRASLQAANPRFYATIRYNDMVKNY
jgi:hypothetical protein